MNRFRTLSLAGALFIFSLGMAQLPDLTGITICLDPGHGGHEGDDRPMPNGFWESESNFTKAVWLETLLMDRGANVVLTRYGNDDDVEDDPGLSERPAVALANDADLFISIHSNAANGQVNYPLPIFNGKTEAPTNPEAKRYCAVLLDHLMVNEATYWTREGRIVGDLTLNPGWTTGYGVLAPLIGTDLPGIISEGSFHDYKPETDRLLNLDYRRQEAYHMYYSLVEFFGLEGREELGNISGIVRDTLLPKDSFIDMSADDAYENVNGTLVELLETGETYRVDSLNTGFYMFDSLTPGDYHLVFSAYGYRNDTVDIEVFPHRFSYHNQWMEVDRTLPPKLSGSSLVEGEFLPCNDPISFTFSIYMDSASCAESFSISPEVAGSFSWDEDYLTMSFQPELPYEVNSQYTITIGAGSEHQWGVALGRDSSFSFTTGDRNRYAVETSFPLDEQTGIDTKAHIRLVFDAPLFTNTLTGAVSIQADDGTHVGISGAETRTIDGQGHYLFRPSEELAPETSYTIRVEGSVQDEDKIPLVDPVEIRFTTGPLLGETMVIYELESLDQWEIDRDASTGMADQTNIYKWFKDYISGEGALLLRYTFAAENGKISIKPNELHYLYSSLDEVGMWVWGDWSGHSVILEFDNEQDLELCKVDFAGWAYRKVAVPAGAGYVTGFRLDQDNDGPMTNQINFDMISQPGSALGSPEFSTLKDLKIWPNPVSQAVIHLDGLDSEAHFALYDLAGALLQEGRLNGKVKSIQLNPGVLENASVLLKVVTDKGMHTELMIIEQ